MAQDYLTEIPYLAQFYGEQAPVHVNYVMALNGVAPRPLDDGFTYCELGSGQGLTANTLAAAYPQGRFYGVDINPEHIKNARAMAEAGRLSNVTFIERPIAELDAVDLPDFDFVTLHGVYSWVSESTRQAIVGFLARKLKIGGGAYVSYNALPGWAGLEPLRRMMVAATPTLVHNPIERAKTGLVYLQFLRDRKAKYFTDHPQAGAMLDLILGLPVNYVAHEYLTPEWNPMYFAEVARELGAAGVLFCGNATLALNYPEFTIPADFQPIFRTAPGRGVLESHRDFVLNARFRRDIFVKPGAETVPEGARRSLFEAMQFGTTQGREALKTKLALDGGEINLEGPIYRPLIEAMAEGVRPLAEIEADPRLKAFAPKEIFDAVKMLVVGGQFGPCARAAAALARLPANRLKIPLPLNRALLEGAGLASEELYLASPVAGNGVPVSLIDGLAMLGLANAPAKEAPEWAWLHLQRSQRTLMHGQVALDGREAHLAALGEAVERVRGPALAKLVECGLVAPA
ncbi:MAG: class I SAM-dependent methyltransferase [Pseudomonadota bacterium]